MSDETLVELRWRSGVVFHSTPIHRCSPYELERGEIVARWDSGRVVTFKRDESLTTQAKQVFVETQGEDNGR